MVSAINSSTPGNPFSSFQSAAGLEAQLDQYKKKLGDWVNCSSGKTPEGKTKIAEISTRISDIQKRINEATATRSNTRVPDPASPPTTDKVTPASAWTTVGTRLDVFA